MAYSPRRVVHFMAKEELYAVPFVRTVIRWLGTFPVRREKGSKEALKNALLLLQQGEVVGIFPEGTRQKGSRVSTLKTGALRLALQAKAPILPAYIAGTEKAFPKGAKFPRPGKIEISIGPPLDFSEHYDAPWDALFLKQETQKIQAALNALRPPWLP